MWFLPVLLGCSSPPSDSGSGLSFVAATFNTGTTEGLAHDAAPDDGYGAEQAVISDTWYGDGLAWKAVVEDTASWLGAHPPDVIGFQELFWSDVCADIPVEAHPGFVCDGWQPGDATVAQQILGQDYQVACHLEKWDKCLAIRKDFGSFSGCEGDLCMDFLDGAEVPDCGSGSRVGRAVVDLVEGGQLTVVNVHGSSGLSLEDAECRAQQIALVFDDLDGSAAANGARNLVLGDFNTDPGRNVDFDVSAASLAAAATGDWRFHTEVGPDAVPTYAGLFNIDHVLSDSFVGGCSAAGQQDLPVVSDVVYLDHVPVVCQLSEP